MDPGSSAWWQIQYMYHSYLFSDLSGIFLLETDKFPFLDISYGPWNHHPTILITMLIFFRFFGYFIAIFHLEKLFLPYLEMHTGPWKQHPPEHHPQPSPYSFLIFSIFYSFFSFSIARPSIYGNAHWTLKQYQPIITTNSSKHHPPIFFWFFPYFIAFFHSA